MLGPGRGLLIAGLALCAAATVAHAQNAAPVTLASPVPVAAPGLSFTGTLTAERFAELSPRVSGLVSSVLVDAGDTAKAGDVLLELDATLVRLELRRAEAALDAAKIELQEAQRLLDEGQRLGTNIAQTVLRSREAAVQLATTEVARLDAERRTEAERLARHSVLAPFDGVVSRKAAEVGEWVETGTPVIEFLSSDRLRLDVQVPQEHFPAVQVGMPVAVQLAAFPDQLFVWSVAAKVPLSDPTVRTFLVRILVDNPSGEMIAGMSAEAAFDLGGGGARLSIPRDAITRLPDDSTRVWVVQSGADGMTAHERRIVIGQRIAETVEVIEGLDADEQVVVRGHETLVEGQPVRVVDETAMR